MPAVIPFIPLIASAVGAGASMYESNKQRQNQKNLMNQQQQIAGQTGQEGKDFLAQGQQALSPAVGYYTSMLANPREATAPEQNRISNMYSGATANALSMGPRGGMFGPSQAANIAQQERQQQQDVIQRGRPMAANALSNIGTQLSGLGLQSQGMGAGIYGNVFNQGLGANQQQYQQGAGLGGSLFNAYQAYLLGRAVQQPSSPGPGSSGGVDWGQTDSLGGWQGFGSNGSYT